MAQVVAFAHNGYFIEKDGSRNFLGLPSALEKLIRDSSKVYCMALGMDGDYFCIRKDKQGRLFYAYRLEKYPQLKQWLDDEEEESFKEDVHFSLGPEGKYYANNGAGQVYQLPDSIKKEIKARLTSNNFYQRDPSQVIIGIDDAYVMVGNKGDVCWDLKGRYGNLDKLLREAVSGVKTIALSPFNDEEYYVAFKNGDTHGERRPTPGRLSRRAGDSSCCVM